MAGSPIVSVRGVINRFGDQLIHDSVDLDVERGEVMGIVGGSGSGKSVLLRTILGLQKPTAGQVLIEGADITAMSERQLNNVKHRYGVTFQQGALFSSLTVAENIQLPLHEYLHLSQASLDELTALRLDMVGLPLSAANKLPAQLSGGMIKRAALARALTLDPQLLFLDEPTAGLDPISAAEFDQLVSYLQSSLKLTVIMITHDLDSILTICDRVAVLVDRKIIVDTLADIMNHPDPWIHEYFHGPRARGITPAPIHSTGAPHGT
jgi:phospholipid/cholesterol/gamma-HCH transport system ATP-binding protein